MNPISILAALGCAAYLGLLAYLTLKEYRGWGGALNTGWLWKHPPSSPLSDQWALDYLVLQGHTKASARKELSRRKAQAQEDAMK